jgi:hypothetical protein
VCGWRYNMGCEGKGKKEGEVRVCVCVLSPWFGGIGVVRGDRGKWRIE